MSGEYAPISALISISSNEGVCQSMLLLLIAYRSGRERDQRIAGGDEDLTLRRDRCLELVDGDRVGATAEHDLAGLAVEAVQLAVARHVPHHALGRAVGGGDDRRA